MEKYKRLFKRIITLLMVATLLLTLNPIVTLADQEEDGEIHYIKNKYVARNGWKEHSQQDIEWFYKCIEAEEGGNSYEAKYLAASCVINRYNKKWGNTLYEVIFAPRQFEVTRNGRIYDAVPTEETIAACNAALDNPEDWVMFFSQGPLHSNTSYASYVTCVDGECFYKEK